MSMCARRPLLGQHQHWGCTCESVEASDLVLAVGCAWTDYSTLAYSLLLQPGKMVAVGSDRVTINGGETYGCIDMERVLTSDTCVLTETVTRGSTQFNNSEAGAACRSRLPHTDEMRQHRLVCGCHAGLQPGCRGAGQVAAVFYLRPAYSRSLPRT
eukprot:GHRQ01007720.1.p1 GENE.GHRQ01007720.1~~GHRQ01007720.1.p1  ORF type:complete len:156 (+),score=26.82 GHRQ01007720.1:491-958(+)